MTDCCPVCLNTTDQVREKDYGERMQINCLRCGPFEITRTALGILASNAERNTLARARLSHGIRSNTSEQKQISITSANVDDLMSKALPSSKQQLRNLMRWLRGQLMNDRLEGISWPWPETLAGLVGAANGERVSSLIDDAVNKGIVERDVETGVIGLSPKGWSLVEMPKNEEEKSRPVVSPAKTEKEVVKTYCNECGGERNAFKRTSYSRHGSDDDTSWSATVDTLECCGCNGLSVRRSDYFSEWDDFDSDPFTGEQTIIPGIKLSYWPPPLKRKKPKWKRDLPDEVLRDLMDEVYQALSLDLIVLASIGVGTLIDRAIYLHIDDPGCGFPQKLDILFDRGTIGSDERDTLKIVTDAGNAAAHRGFAPDSEMLATIVDTAESFLHRAFILKNAAAELKVATPPRQPKRRGK